MNLKFYIIMSVLQSVQKALPGEKLEEQMALAAQLANTCGAICEDAEGMEALMESYED